MSSLQPSLTNIFKSSFYDHELIIDFFNFFFKFLFFRFPFFVFHLVLFIYFDQLAKFIGFELFCLAANFQFLRFFEFSIELGFKLLKSFSISFRQSRKDEFVKNFSGYVSFLWSNIAFLTCFEFLLEVSNLVDFILHLGQLSVQADEPLLILGILFDLFRRDLHLRILLASKNHSP